ncbi:MAG TPA: phosphatidylglycerol lysyltransferase domain-containing protein [Bacillota bacterium]|nr:phosphatidylglycerol lysyltransferase domain-containing protein [Bacillota bacterium]
MNNTSTVSSLQEKSKANQDPAPHSSTKVKEEITFEPITLETLKRFQEYYPINHFELSDLSPASLWVWRTPYKVSWSIIEGLFCFRCHHEDETYYLPPVGANYEKFAHVLQTLKVTAEGSGHPLRFRAIPREMLTRINMVTGQSVNTAEDRANWDYLYLTQDLIDLKGRKYQHIRNQINKFENVYQYEYVPMKPEDFPQVEAIFSSWAAVHSDELTVSDEREALHEAFVSFEQLNLKGGMILVGDEAVAFSIGSSLKDDTVQIHFQKARPEYNGAYALVSREFIAHSWHQTTYVNWEDDLGLPGLREAKRRYHPIKMVEKYIVDLV